jgi:hypothetical protein
LLWFFLPSAFIDGKEIRDETKHYFSFTGYSGGGIGSSRLDNCGDGFEA